MDRYSIQYAYADAISIIAEHQPISVGTLNSMLISKGYTISVSASAISNVAKSHHIKMDSGKLYYTNI